jgi:hypothetical protein
MKKQPASFWFLQVSGWLFAADLLYAQAVPAINYELGVAMGTQEPATQITEVGAAFWYGFAFGDAVFYIPLLIVGLIAFAKGRDWGRGVLIAAMGITVYWPIVCLSAVVTARGAPGWSLPKESDYWIVLPVIALWGVWGLWWLISGDKRVALAVMIPEAVSKKAKQ